MDFCKTFERFWILFKNKKQPICWANLPPDTLGWGQKVIIPDDQHGKTNKNVHLRFLIFENSSHTF
jgi:hypothetical protein